MRKEEEDVYDVGGLPSLRGANRPRVYRFPPLEACRKAFEDLIGHTLDWGEEEDAAKAA